MAALVSLSSVCEGGRGVQRSGLSRHGHKVSARARAHCPGIPPGPLVEPGLKHKMGAAR